MNESKCFLSYNPYSNNGKVFVANRSFIPINSKGFVSISPSITFDLVLYVLKINLLSINKITKPLNCCVKFYPTHYVFEDLITRKKIGNAKKREGSHYMISKVKDNARVLIYKASKNKRVEIWSVSF